MANSLSFSWVGSAFCLLLQVLAQITSYSICFDHSVVELIRCTQVHHYLSGLWRKPAVISYLLKLSLPSPWTLRITNVTARQNITPLATDLFILQPHTQLEAVKICCNSPHLSYDSAASSRMTRVSNFEILARKTGKETGWRHRSTEVGKCDVTLSRAIQPLTSSYIRCFARLIFPRIFHYLCLRLYREDI